MRCTGHTGQPTGGVQAGDGAVRRRGSFDGHRRGGWGGAVARDHDRTRRSGRSCGAALRWHGQPVHRRTNSHGGIRRPDRARRPRPSGLHRGVADPVGGQTAGRPRYFEATISICSSASDSTPAKSLRARSAPHTPPLVVGRDGAADGGCGATRRCAVFAVDRPPRRANDAARARRSRRRQGLRRTGAGPPTACRSDQLRS